MISIKSKKFKISLNNELKITIFGLHHESKINKV